MRHIIRSYFSPIGFTIVALLLVASSAGAQEVIEYYGTDHLGSVRLVFDAAGTIQSRADYLPFGEEVFAPTGLMPVNRFTGQARDGESGQDYFHARSYLPRTGRFGSTDPVFAGVLDTQQWNRYTYARSSPLVFTDPSGLCNVITDKSGKEYAVGCDSSVTVYAKAPSGGGGGLSTAVSQFVIVSPGLNTGSPRIGSGRRGGGGGAGGRTGTATATAEPAPLTQQAIDAAAECNPLTMVGCQPNVAVATVVGLAEGTFGSLFALNPFDSTTSCVTVAFAAAGKSLMPYPTEADVNIARDVYIPLSAAAGEAGFAGAIGVAARNFTYLAAGLAAVDAFDAMDRAATGGQCR